MTMEVCGASLSSGGADDKGAAAHAARGRKVVMELFDRVEAGRVA